MILPVANGFGVEDCEAETCTAGILESKLDLPGLGAQRKRASITKLRFVELQFLSVPADFDSHLRLFVYRQTIRTGKVPSVAESARLLGSTVRQVRSGLLRLSKSHAFMLQENRELWRVAPFSAIPTPFPVRLGKKSWFGNCIWDALGIPAMLGKDAQIGASCGCCNEEMPVEVKSGRLSAGEGIIHIAVPARDWYKDVVFT